MLLGTKMYKSRDSLQATCMIAFKHDKPDMLTHELYLVLL